MITSHLDNFIRKDKMNEEEIEEIVARYREGDRDCRDILINELLPYATKIGCVYGHAFNLKGFRFSELVAESYYALVDILDEADVRLVDNNIKTYIRSILAKRLKAFLWEDCVIRVPQGTKGKARAKIEHAFDFEVYDDDTTSRLMDDLDIIIENPMEHDFVAYKMAGYKNYEVAEKLGISQNEVSKMRSSLYQRFAKLQGLEI